MEIIEIDHIKALPAKVRGYSLNANYTEKDAMRDYRMHYGVDAVKGWLWKSGPMVYFYLGLPEKEVV